MPAKKGNKNGLKLKDPDVRQEAYMKFCDWLSKGKSPRSFTFKKGDLKCTGQTIESYIALDPVEFPPIHKQFSFCEGHALWEQVVEDSATGLNKEANTASLQMLMRNKYEWDKKEVAQTQTASEHVQFRISEAKELNGKGHKSESQANRQPQECYIED